MKRVLVVDDNTSATFLVELTLLRLGCEVTVVRDGCTAVKKAIGETFDAAVINFEMTDCEGLDAIKAIQMVDPNIRVVVVGPGEVEGLQKAAKDAGAYGFLQKPINDKLAAVTLGAAVSDAPCGNCCGVDA